MIKTPKASVVSILKNDGPWGSGSDKNNDKTNKTKDLDESIDDAIKKGQEMLKNFISGNGGGKNSNKNSKKPQNPNSPSKKSLTGIVILVIAALWLSTGIFKVNSDENAVILYFGKFYSISKPGLNYRIPAPFSKMIKRSVTKVNTEEFGESFRKQFYNNSSESVNLMLTGDENIVDIDFQVQWQISDIKDYVFNLTNTKIALQKTSESAMREIIARTPIADALSDGKQKIEQEAKLMIQGVLDSYGAGIRIVLVQLLRVDPPKQVIDSFRDVQTAKADKEKVINQAEAFRNDVIPRARGEAAKLTQEAEAYQESVISNAIGETRRFLDVYNEYSKAKFVTKRRIFLETMEKIYENTDKIIIDKNISKSGVVPYLPLDKLKNK